MTAKNSVSYKQTKTGYSVTRGGKVVERIAFADFKSPIEAEKHLWHVFDYWTRKDSTRAANPAPRLGTKRPRRVSQVTKKLPTTRLVKRRKANVQPGYFPNPLEPKVHRRQRKKNINHPVNFPYGVEYLNPGTGHWNILSAFKELKNAKEYARAWADANPKFSVRVDYLKEV
jgi:hypothetical protein